jgi:hypothetical protein
MKKLVCMETIIRFFFILLLLACSLAIWGCTFNARLDHDGFSILFKRQYYEEKYE